MKQTWLAAGSEPRLEDMLQDDEMHLLLRRDGLTAGDVRRHAAEARRRLSRRTARDGAQMQHTPAPVAAPVH